jgi:hypothetical protein
MGDSNRSSLLWIQRPPRAIPRMPHDLVDERGEARQARDEQEPPGGRSSDPGVTDFDGHRTGLIWSRLRIGADASPYIGREGQVEDTCRHDRPGQPPPTHEEEPAGQHADGSSEGIGEVQQRQASTRLLRVPSDQASAHQGEGHPQQDRWRENQKDGARPDGEPQRFRRESRQPP